MRQEAVVEEAKEEVVEEKNEPRYPPKNVSYAGATTATVTRTPGIACELSTVFGDQKGTTLSRRIGSAASTVSKHAEKITFVSGRDDSSTLPVDRSTPSSGQLVTAKSIGKKIAARRHSSRIANAHPPPSSRVRKKLRQAIVPDGHDENGHDENGHDENGHDENGVEILHDRRRGSERRESEEGAGEIAKGNNINGESVGARKIRHLEATMRCESFAPPFAALSDTLVPTRSRLSQKSLFMRRLLKIVAIALACGAALLLLVAVFATVYWRFRGVPMSDIPERLVQLQTEANVSGWVHHTYVTTIYYGEVLTSSGKAAGNALRYRVAPLLYDSAVNGLAYIDQIARTAAGGRRSNPQVADTPTTMPLIVVTEPPATTSFVTAPAQDRRVTQPPEPDYSPTLQIPSAATVTSTPTAHAYETRADKDKGEMSVGQEILMSQTPYADMSAEGTRAIVSTERVETIEMHDNPSFVAAASAAAAVTTLSNSQSQFVTASGALDHTASGPTPALAPAFGSTPALAPDVSARETMRMIGSDMIASDDVNANVDRAHHHRLRLEAGRPSPNERTVSCLICGLVCTFVARYAAQRYALVSTVAEPGDADEEEEENEIESFKVVGNSNQIIDTMLSTRSVAPQAPANATPESSSVAKNMQCDMCRTCDGISVVLARQLGVRRIVVSVRRSVGDGNGNRGRIGFCNKSVSGALRMGKRLLRGSEHECADLPALAVFQTQAHQHVRAVPLTSVVRQRAVDIHLARRYDGVTMRKLMFDPRSGGGEDGGGDGGGGLRLYWDADVATESSDAMTAQSDVGECITALRAAASLASSLNAHTDLALHIEAHAADMTTALSSTNATSTSGTFVAPSRFWSFMADLGAPCLASALSDWRRRALPFASTTLTSPILTPASSSSSSVSAFSNNTPGAGKFTNNVAALYITSVAASAILVRYIPGNGSPPRHHTIRLQPPPSSTSLVTALTHLLSSQSI
jgi:hypothetical protein